MKLNIERIKGLCFDVDGTLSDTDDKWVHQLTQKLMPVKFLFPKKDPSRFARRVVMISDTPGNLVYTILDRLGLDNLVSKILKSISNKDEKKKGKFWLIPGTVETLDQLFDHYPMAVVSARGGEGTKTFLQQFEMEKHFQTVVSGQTCKYTKPFPDPVIFAAEQMGLKAEDCLMIGDTTVDIKAGKAAGAQTVGVLSGLGSEGELRRAGADLIVDSVVDLVELLNGKQTE